jgi:hypothetical protein
LENLREKDHLGDPGIRVDRRIILIWIFKKYNVGVCTGFSWLRIETGDRNEPSGSTKCGEFLD